MGSVTLVREHAGDQPKNWRVTRPKDWRETGPKDRRVTRPKDWRETRPKDWRGHRTLGACFKSRDPNIRMAEVWIVL